MRPRSLPLFLCSALLPLALPSNAQETLPAAAVRTYDGVSFAGDAGRLYLPAREAAQALGWNFGSDRRGRRLTLNRRPLRVRRRLANGTALASTADLRERGATVTWDTSENAARVMVGAKEIRVRKGLKRVAVSLDRQRMRAWEGERLVLDTRVSTGQRGHRTPAGEFRAGPAKERLHLSRRYPGSRMPWSVQVQGHVFIHGFTSVPAYSASHGCVRVPLTRGNPARWFWEWVDVGTPISIRRGWPGGRAG